MRMSRVMISSLNLVFERDREVKSVTLACEYYLGPKNTVVMRDPDGIIGTLSSIVKSFVLQVPYQSTISMTACTIGFLASHRTWIAYHWFQHMQVIFVVKQNCTAGYPQWKSLPSSMGGGECILPKMWYSTWVFHFLSQVPPFIMVWLLATFKGKELPAVR